MNVKNRSMIAGADYKIKKTAFIAFANSHGGPANKTEIIQPERNTAST